MTTSTQSDLIVLIRLLHDDLSAAEGAAVRRKLADSRDFARKYRALNAVLSESLDAGRLLESVTDVEPEQVARFVDQSMDHNESGMFETACWQSKAVLREVAATWRATKEQVVDRTPSVEFENRMQDVIVAQLHPNGRRSVAANLPPVSSSISGSEAGLSSSVAAVDRLRRSSGRSNRLAAGLILMAATAVVIVGILAAREFLSDDADPGKSSQDQMAQEAPQEPNTLQPEPQDPPEPDPGHRDSGEVVVIPPPKSNDSVAPDRTNTVVDNPPVVPRPDVPGMPRPPIVPDPNVPRPTPRRVALINQWRKVSGVVAMNSDNAPRWRGVRHEMSQQGLLDESSDGFITLADGQATADLVGGEQLTIGTDTFLRAIGSVTRSDASDLIGELTLEYGRLAVANLADQRSVRILAGAESFDVQAIGSDVDFTVEQSFGAIVFAIQKGTVQINQQRASKDSWLRFESGTLSSLPPRERAFEWMKGPPVKGPLSTRQQDALNKSDDFISDARALMSSTDRQVAAYGARALIDLADARNPHALPVGFIQGAIGSRSELQREALVRWILSCHERRPERTNDIWDAILLYGQKGAPALNARSQEQLRAWYEAAVSRTAPDIALMGQLASRLRPSNHVFARQSAKFFLQQILNNDLAEYDAANPSTRAVNSVATKIRRWQQDNPSR